MKTTINLEKMPHGYLLCINTQCSQSSTCLRHLAGQNFSPDLPSMCIINPQWYARLCNGCHYYRPSEKERYAQGFIRMLDSLPKKKFDAAVFKLKLAFNGRNYYRVRKGERLLSPAEQQKVRDILRSEGVTDIPDFDAYVEEHTW